MVKEEEEEIDELEMDELNDPDTMETIECEWANCGLTFWELEPFLEHLLAGKFNYILLERIIKTDQIFMTIAHAHPTTATGESVKPGAAPPKKGSGAIWSCDWVGCPRRGKNQSNKFALVSHFRAHSGERPFTCPEPGNFDSLPMGDQFGTNHFHNKMNNRMR